MKQLIIAAFLICCNTTYLAANEGHLKLVFFNVGYGDAMLIETPEGQFALIDTGASDEAAGLIEKIRLKGCQHLNHIILTHNDIDHTGGLEAILSHLTHKDLTQIFINKATHRHNIYKNNVDMLQKENLPFSSMQTGDNVFLSESVSLDVLSADSEASSENNASIVIRITFGETSFLLTGDIMPNVQNKLALSMPEKITSNLVKFPHHGSKLDQDFKNLIQDAIIILSTDDNPWFEPLSSDKDLLNENLFRTDVHGDITAISDGKKIEITYEKSL